MERASSLLTTTAVPPQLRSDSRYAACSAENPDGSGSLLIAAGWSALIQVSVIANISSRSSSSALRTSAVSATADLALTIPTRSSYMEVLPTDGSDTRRSGTVVFLPTVGPGARCTSLQSGRLADGGRAWYVKRRCGSLADGMVRYAKFRCGRLAG